jgi:hypothetical protein
MREVRWALPSATCSMRAAHQAYGLGPVGYDQERFQKCAGGLKDALFPAARMLALLEGAASLC